MAKYAVPCVISLLVAALYNIVDQIFIANADYLGSYGNAANTVVFPLTVVALSIAVMIGDGCCAFVSISLGRNDKEAAHNSNRQRGPAVHCLRSDFDGDLSCSSRTDPDFVRWTGQRRNLPPRKGIFFLDHPGCPVLYVRSGTQSHHPLRWKPQVRHGLYPGGSCRQYHSGPHLHLCFSLGNDGRGGYGAGANHHGCSGGPVSVPHESRSAGTERLPFPWYGRCCLA